MHRALSLIVAILLTLALVGPTAAAAGTVVKQKIRTFEWSVPSPDPTGLAFLANGRLLVVDSEVEETALDRGKNFWRITTSGDVLKTMSTLDFTNEPTDVAVDRTRNVWYFSTDSDHNGVNGRIFIVGMGPDGQFGTGDDRRRSFGTGNLTIDVPDPEGLAFGGGSLWIGGGSGRKVVRIQPGPNGRIDGKDAAAGGDDVITSFGVGQFGITDLEGIEYGPNRHIYVLGNQPNANIVELTKSGSKVREIDLSAAKLRAPSDLAWGPASGNPDNKNFYIADRGIDNNADPNENDGRIIEVKIVEQTGNLIANGGFEKDRDADDRPDSWSENEAFTVTAQVVDSGSFAAKHQSAAEATYSVRQTIGAIAAGETYHFSGRVNIPDTTDDFRFRLRMVWFGSNGAKISASGIESFSADTDGNWVDAAGDVTAPAGAITGKMYMSVSGLSATVYVDTFSLTGS